VIERYYGRLRVLMVNRKLFLNILCEFGPIIAFLVAYSLISFEAGTIAMIVSVIIALFALWTTEHHLPLFAILSTLTVVIFGGISLFVHIPGIFILRDTIFDAAFAIVLFISVYNGKPLLKIFFKNVFAITDKGWQTLTLRWAYFFLILAAVNEWVRRHLTADEWVEIKVYMIFATLIFGFYQFTLSRRERLPDATPWGLVH
jgi:intracellular septation protein